jgi:hypothetical protein
MQGYGKMLLAPGLTRALFLKLPKLQILMLQKVLFKNIWM